jgi:hypothetical protein
MRAGDVLNWDPPPLKGRKAQMITAETQAMARKLIAGALAEGEAGKLDARVYEALKRAIDRGRLAQPRRRRPRAP